MFYRLSHINQTPLPAALLIDETPYVVVRGGLLLEPPGPKGVGEGHSIIKFFGRWLDEEPHFIGSCTEPYRRDSVGQLDVSRRDSDPGGRFIGAVEADTVRLRWGGGARFMERGTQLTFVAAPHEPITRDWSQTFDYGPHVTVESAAKDNPLLQEAVWQRLAQEEPERHRRGQARLERAWRATA